MFLVGMIELGWEPEFPPVEVDNAAAAIVTLTEQLGHDAPEHPVEQLSAADIRDGYRVAVNGIEYWIERR